MTGKEQTLEQTVESNENRGFFRKHWKKLGLGIFTLATLTGSYGGNKKSFFPFYNEKTGTSYGINLALVNQFDEGATHYGINLGFFNSFKDSTINGLNIGLASEYNGNTLNGINLNLGGGQAVGNMRHSNLNGVEIAFFNTDDEGFRNVHGFQVGAINHNAGGRNVQFGICNSSGKEIVSRGIGLLLNNHPYARDEAQEGEK